MKNQQKLINIEKENVLKPSVWPTFVRNNQGIFLYIKSKIGLWSLFFHSKRTCCNESENFYDEPSRLYRTRCCPSDTANPDLFYVDLPLNKFTERESVVERAGMREKERRENTQIGADWATRSWCLIQLINQSSLILFRGGSEFWNWPLGVGLLLSDMLRVG